MSVEVKVPRLAESIADATLVEWLKGDGEAVRLDEPIATLETDKAAVEIAATESGVLRHARKVGEVVRVDDVLARIEPGAVPAVAAARAGRARPPRLRPAAAASAARRAGVPRSRPRRPLRPRPRSAPRCVACSRSTGSTRRS